jgi:hypothetical protein
MKKILVFIVLIIAAFSVLGLYSKQKATVSPSNISETISRVFYKGENGQDALTLLRKNFSVSFDNSGMVNAISNRKADSQKHEYWAFYVNGEMAKVGSADYKTKNTDLIEWKIEKY